MVQTDAPSITTRLQARVDAQDEKIQLLTNEMKGLSTTVTSMQDMLKTFPDSMEKLITNLLNKHGKQSHKSDDDGSIHILASASGTKPPGGGPGFFLHDDHFSDTPFSLPKVKLPLFDGIDPRGWITKAELYFHVHQTPEPQKLQLVQMCMDGIALNWFTTLLYKHPQTSWGQFRSKLMIRFSGTRFLNAYEALGSLYQEEDVDDYIEQFEAISALITDQSEEQSIGMFIRGLQEDIRNWVRTLNPITCDEAMDVARRVEVAISNEERSTTGGRYPVAAAGYFSAHPRKKYFGDLGPKSIKPNYREQSQPIGPGIQQPNSSNGVPIRPPDAGHPKRHTGTHHLSKQEWEDRRKRGLCFGCGEKFSPSTSVPKEAYE